MEVNHPGCESRTDPLTKTADEGAEDLAGKLPSIQQKVASDCVFTCAVSGCSSSGKTTLAILLHESFRPFQPFSINILGDDTSVYGDTVGSLSIIHQDAFFASKPLCPITTFMSTANDANYIRASIEAKADGGYFYSRTGKEELDTPTLVTGPDVDCVEALDFERILKIVSAIRSSGESEYVESPDENLGTVREELLRPYSELISKMRRKIEIWMEKQQKKGAGNIHYELDGSSRLSIKFSRKFLFIEGFLILTDPEDQNPPQINMSEPERLETVLQAVPDDARETILRTQAEERVKRPARHEARKALMNHFDVKLFLPTEKAVAKQRRLARTPYLDPPAGTRNPGQMWKTEGYFEDVVWSSYLRDFKWMSGGDLDVSAGGNDEEILGTGEVAEGKGIRVRPSQRGSIEETVSWGVEAILSGFETLVD